MNVEDNGVSSDDGADDGVVIDNDTGAVISADDSAATDNEGEGQGDDAPPAKPKKSAQERIDELTRARREAEREAEFWRAKATQPQTEPKTEPQPKGDGRPDPATFAAGEYDPAYIEALIDWKADQKLTARLVEREQKTEAQKRQETFQQRVDAAKSKFSDFDEKVFGGAQTGAWVCTQEMLETLQESDLGAEVAYHLASNPAEAQRIASLTPRAQAMAIGKLEAKLGEAPKQQPKTVSSAPDPAPTTRGTSGRFQVAPDTQDFAAFDKAY